MKLQINKNQAEIIAYLLQLNLDQMKEESATHDDAISLISELQSQGVWGNTKENDWSHY